jgi:excisionase family DNA binding protein
MSARTKQPLWPVAVSLRYAADCLGVRREKILSAVRAGHLPAYRSGTQVRCLVSDLEELVRKHWLPFKIEGDPNGTE